MWVKICGNTNLDDCLLAVELGADALGFVFAPSVRRVMPAQAGTIIRDLPSTVEKVGVFPAWDAERIAAIALEAGLTAIQLHGGWDRELASRLSRRVAHDVGIIQVFHWDVAEGHSQSTLLQSQIAELAHEPSPILIDSKLGAALGGTGRTLDWDAARPLFAAHPNTILAGGLTPENLSTAMQTLKPWGVDVVSGVEASPGKKDRGKLERFMNAARKPSMPSEPSPAR